MSDYENAYNNMVNSIKAGEEPFKRSKQVQKFHKELDREEFLMETMNKEREKRKESEDDDRHFQLWSEGEVEDKHLDHLFGKKR